MRGNINWQVQLVCRYCGNEIVLWLIWHPKYGKLFDEYENIKAGKYTPFVIVGGETENRGSGCSVWPPPEMYNYRCSQCNCKMEVNEAIIDVEVAMAEYEGRWHEGFMPVLGCPGCNQDTMESVEV